MTQQDDYPERGEQLDLSRLHEPSVPDMHDANTAQVTDLLDLPRDRAETVSLQIDPRRNILPHDPIPHQGKTVHLVREVMSKMGVCGLAQTETFATGLEVQTFFARFQGRDLLIDVELFRNPDDSEQAPFVRLIAKHVKAHPRHELLRSRGSQVVVVAEVEAAEAKTRRRRIADYLKS